MSETLKSFYNACNPLKPAEPHQYVTSDEARGSENLALDFKRNLDIVRDDYLCFLFSGHTGCGKSSELRNLALRLDNPDPRKSEKAFFPIILDVTEFIDEYDVTPTDLLLAIVTQVSESFLEKLDIQLADSLIYRRVEELKKLLFSEVELQESSAEAGIPGLAKLNARIKLLRKDPTRREMVRDALSLQTSTLIEEIQLLFSNARLKMQGKRNDAGLPYADFVLILDNLEKIQRIKGFADGFQSHREFFIERSAQLTGLGAHVVYTVPLPLVISCGGELTAKYGTEPAVLPMIKVAERQTHERFNTGWRTLEELVQRRAGNAPWESIIDRDALEFLIRYSGGHVRYLMMFLRNATALTDTAPITLKAAERAIGDTVSLFSRMPLRYWKVLAALELSEGQQIEIENNDVKDMLMQLMILEYRNGEVGADAFNHNAPWYAVHPIIRELLPFKAAVEELKKKGKVEEPY